MILERNGGISGFFQESYESYGGCYLHGIPIRGVVPVAAFADDKCTVAIDTLLTLFSLLAESTTDVFFSGISRIVIA